MDFTVHRYCHFTSNSQDFLFDDAHNGYQSADIRFPQPTVSHSKQHKASAPTSRRNQ
jgi:hypothetical protein